MSLHIPELPNGIDILSAALRYAGAGWFVLPIRLDGSGKHPGSVLGKGWQHKTSRNADVIASWFAGAAEGQYGLALHVGRSGAVAFDVDEPSAAPPVLVEAVLSTGAPYQSTRDADNGRGHYLFSAEPGSVGNSAAGLGKGWGEVRGLNGIIVVAPTPHGKADQGGLYRWERGGALPDMPPALAAATRPPQGGAEPADWGELHEWLEALPAGDPNTPVAAVDITMPPAGRYDRMRDASMELVGYGVRGYPGVRDRLVELGQRYIEAVKIDRAGGERTARSEFVRAVAGALHNVDDRPLADVTFQSASELVAKGLFTPAQIVANQSDEVPAYLRWTMTASQLVALPRPDPIIPGMLYRDRMAWLIGKSGSFKSFVALDLAAAVAAEDGRKWLGRPVFGGPVLYIVAEGIGGMGLRVEAWTKRFGPMSERLRLFPRAVQVTSEAWSNLVEMARQVQPALIVIDTQARVSVGINENSNGDMGTMIAKFEELREATRACVMPVHHIGRHGSDARGASAIDGAQDTELKIERVGGTASRRARLIVDKQKDASTEISVDLHLEKVDLGTDPVTGEEWSSLVVSPDLIVEPFPVAAYRDIEITNKNQAMILDILRELFDEDGGSRADVAKAWKERGGWAGAEKWPHNTFYRAWNALLQKDLIGKVQGSQRFRIAKIDEA